MINEIIDYIKYECINRISGQKLNIKIKVITKREICYRRIIIR